MCEHMCTCMTFMVSNDHVCTCRTPLGIMNEEDTVHKGARDTEHGKENLTSSLLRYTPPPQVNAAAIQLHRGSPSHSEMANRTLLGKFCNCAQSVEHTLVNYRVNVAAWKVGIA